MTHSVISALALLLGAIGLLLPVCRRQSRKFNGGMRRDV